MIISGTRVENIVISSNKTGGAIAVIDDEGIRLDPDYKVESFGANDNESIKKHAIVKPGDMLYYGENPEELYAVCDSDEKFFTMAKLTLNVRNDVTIDYTHRRTYPNNKTIGTLEDYGLILKEVPEDDAKEEEHER